MWQRIQTLFMILAVILLGAMFFLPLSLFSTSTYSGLVYVYGLKPQNGIIPFQMSGLWIQSVIIAISMIVITISLFMYKQRMKQMKVLMIAVLTNIILIGLVFYFNDRIENIQTDDYEIAYKLGAIMPLLSLLLLMMSGRAIRRDEAKVRAAGRLR